MTSKKAPSRKTFSKFHENRFKFYAGIPLGASFFMFLFWLVAGLAPVKDAHTPPANASVVEIYQTAKNVPQSQKVGSLLDEVVKKRIACYTVSPLNRANACIPPYLRDIVAIGRQQLVSAPDMGAFMRNVRFCPISYSVCMGEKSDSAACVRTEAACVDFIFDNFWRGRPFEIELQQGFIRRNRIMLKQPAGESGSESEAEESTQETPPSR
jgi:hypothetical protein